MPASAHVPHRHTATATTQDDLPGEDIRPAVEKRIAGLHGQLQEAMDANEAYLKEALAHEQRSSELELQAERTARVHAEELAARDRHAEQRAERCVAG